VVFGQLLLLLGSCSVDEIDLDGKACPCATGYRCDEARQICVHDGADASVGGTAGVGGSLGGASGTGASGGTSGASGSGGTAGASGASGSGGIAGASGASGSGGTQATDAGTCSDGTKNGAETDVDCGGGTCSPCPDGKACVASSDCVNKCVQQKCCGSNCQ